MRGAILILAIATVLPSPVFSEVAKVNTEDAFTTSPGGTEVELFYGFAIVDEEYDSDGDPVDTPDWRAHRLALSVSHGILERLDVGLAIEGIKLHLDESDGIDEGVGVFSANSKWRFFESEDGDLALSWLAGFSGPFGSAAGELDAITLLPTFWSIDNLFAFTWVEKRFNLSADAGFFVPVGSARGTIKTAAVADAAVGYQVVKWFQPELEINYVYDFIQAPTGNAALLGLTLGAIFNVSDFMRLDLGVARGVIGQGTEALTTASANLSWTF